MKDPQNKDRQNPTAGSLFAAILLLTAVALSACAPEKQVSTDRGENRSVKDSPELSNVFGDISDTKPYLPGRITIQTVGVFEFDPAAVRSVRTDIFSKGYFSLFDILVHLDRNNEIDLEYHFDPEADIHIIDSLDGESNWWYRAYYDGGWSENNVFPMDQYPYKDRMTIRIHPQKESRLYEVHDLFRREIAEKRLNGGAVFVKKVIINGRTTRLHLENIRVSAHNLRSDIFQDGIVTAIDVIMSLGDQGLLDYDLRWYESIGDANIVKNYYVDRIKEERIQGRCGFVYEAGDLNFRGRGNHIHLPPDTRIIHAPEYVEFFWICV